MAEDTFVKHCLALNSFLPKVSCAQARLQQVKTLKNMLESMPSLKDPGVIAQAISSSALRPEEKSEVFGALGAKVSSMRPSLCLQNYTNVWTCIPQSMWQELKELSAQKQLTALANFAFMLGLRQPSEPSLQVLTACFVLLAHQHDNWTPAIKYEQLKLVRKAFKDIKGAQPVEDIKVLPEGDDLKQLFPKTYQLCFGDQAMVFQPTVLPIFEFNALRTSIPMRSSRQDSSARSCSSVAATSSSNMQQTMMQMFQMFIAATQQQPNAIPHGFRMLPARQLALPATSSPEVSVDLPIQEQEEEPRAQLKVPSSSLALFAAATSAAEIEKGSKSEKAALSKDKVQKKEKKKGKASISKKKKSEESIIEKKKSEAAISKKSCKKEAEKTFALCENGKPKNAIELRPLGCGKCRKTPGCTPSCWKQRMAKKST